MHVIAALILGVAGTWPSHQAATTGPTTLAAVLQQGYLYPFATFVSPDWVVADLSSPPGAWTFHPTADRRPRQLRSGAVSPPGFCGALVPPLPPVLDRNVLPPGSPSSDVHAAHGLAVRGGSGIVPFDRLDAAAADASADRVRTVRQADLERSMRQAYGNLPGRQELERSRQRDIWWRTAIPVNGRHLYRAELSIEWLSASAEVGGMLDLELWIIDDARAGKASVAARFFETDSSLSGIKTSTTVTPFGVLVIEARAYVVSDEHGWEHVDYLIRELRGVELVERIRVTGVCAG